MADLFRRPLDGQGLLSPVDPDFAMLRRWAAARWRRRLPWGVGGLVAGMARLLGDPKAHGLLADKMASARFFAACGLPMPATLAVIGRGEDTDLGVPPWTRPAALIAKPRHGAAGRGVMAITILPGPCFCVQGEKISPAELGRRLHRLSQTDEVLIQERLTTTDALTDLATGGRAPILRLTTAREPGGAPFLYAALLEIDVPDENPHHFIRGRIRVPIDPGSGLLQDGIWFLQPARRLSRLPWNDACLAGRAVPGFAAAVAAVLRAAALLPVLPLASWDLIICDDGPRILEGNSAGDWILNELPRCAGLRSPPLAPLLRHWIPA